MVATSYLRVYQPASAFGDEERVRWLSQRDAEVTKPLGVLSKWLVTSTLRDAARDLESEGAFVRHVGDQLLLCPFRTRLRALAGLLAFRQSLPEEVADAFVPEDVAHGAARELATLSDGRPDVRSHILHSNWHVPLRWFVAFDASERILVEDRDGLRIRYETSLAQAKARFERALVILDASGMRDDVATAVRELALWIEDFPGDGLVELDYGTVSGIFASEALVDDASAADVWACLDALSSGDVMRAGRVFAELSERWVTARAHEVVN